MAEKILPTRTPTQTDLSDDEAVPDTNPSSTTGLLVERLQAWKHMCGYLENYITATEKAQKAHSKEYEKILKSVSDPLKEGHHFAQELGGVAGLFENIRSNTQVEAPFYVFECHLIYHCLLGNRQPPSRDGKEPQRNCPPSPHPSPRRDQEQIKRTAVWSCQVC